jgi:sarcosine oxidase/L-pipecolate oxidase
VKPLFKKGERRCISNYRPISLLTSFSKVFEKVIYNRLLEHLNSNNILIKEQFGFRKNLTIEKANYERINYILNVLKTNEWIKSCLKNRYQRVKIKKQKCQF